MQEKVREVQGFAGKRATGTYRRAMAVELANCTFATAGVEECEPAAVAIGTFEDNIWNSGSPLKYRFAEVSPLNASREIVLQASLRQASPVQRELSVQTMPRHLERNERASPDR